MIASTLLAVCLNGAIAHEGFRDKQYKDTNGYSIGYGYSLTQNPLALPKAEISKLKQHGITKWQATSLAKKMCHKLHDDLTTEFTWYNTLPNNVQYVMLDMSYNMGVGGMSSFKQAVKYIRNNKYQLASNELLHSRWARQVHGRATELANVLTSGQFA
jgi:lysozyme